MAFSSGRLVAYAIIGGIVSALSGALRLFLSAESFVPFQAYSSMAFGVVTIIIGVTILLRIKSSPCTFNMEGNGTISQQKEPRQKIGFRAFSLGFSRGLAVCPPLLALLLYSLPFAAPIDGLVIALLFGIGTVVSPLLLLGGVTGCLLNKAPLFRKWIAIFGGGILIVLGLITLLTAILAL